VTCLAAIGLVWFVVGLALIPGRAEGGPRWRSTGALLSGVLLAGYVLLDANPQAAAFRGADLDPALARNAFDNGNIGFANARLAIGSCAVACGWVVLSTGLFPRWLGSWAADEASPARPAA
jgi:hypothetical protein